MSRHNDLRDAIARNWQQSLTTRIDPVLSIKCECGVTANSLLAGAAEVGIEYPWQGKRPDIVLLDAQGAPRGFAEVVDSHPPSAEMLELYERTGIPVFIIPWSSHRTLRGFCSVQCWNKRPGTLHHRLDLSEEPEEPLDGSLLWCKSCECRLTEREAIVDCTGDSCPNCIGKGIIHLCCWGRRDPFNGGGWLDPDPTLAEKLAFWNTVDFWRFVWDKRLREPKELREEIPDEQLTQSALIFVCTAIAYSEWARAYHLLFDVGYKPLTAWGRSNCLTVAQCWAQLEEHAESLLPQSWEIERRGPDWD